MKCKNILLPITIITFGLSVALMGSELFSSRRALKPTSIVSQNYNKVQKVRSGNLADSDLSNITASNDTESDVMVTDAISSSTNPVALEFLTAHPEAAEYVAGFDRYAGSVFDTNVGSEVKKGQIPLFIQWDKRWGYASYGQSYIGISGCGPTCLSMVVCGLKGDGSATPYDVSKYAEKSGFYIAGQGTSWSLMTAGAVHYGLKFTNGSVSAGYILGNLSEKTPMICSMKPGDFTAQGHFIVLTGIDKEGRIIINDPVSPLNSSKHWSVDALIPQIKNIWKYSY